LAHVDLLNAGKTKQLRLDLCFGREFRWWCIIIAL